MSKALKGLGLVAALAAAGLAWSADRQAADPSAPELEKETRTAEREVTVGSYSCFGAASGEVTVTVNYEGTAGVFAMPEGFSVKITTVVPAAEADPTCLSLTEDFGGVLAGYPCVTSQVRLIGSTRDLVFVCTGNRTQVIDAVGATAAFVAGNVRAAS